MNSANKIFNNLLDGLTDRQREVISGRFGLDKSGKRLTLAALGAKYSVTRERIRQIETSAIDGLRAKIATNPASGELIEKTKKFLKDEGGVAKKDVLLEYGQSFVEGLSDNHLLALAEASKAFHYYSEDKDFYPFYYLDKPALKAAVNFISQWESFLKGKKDQVLEGKYVNFLSDFMKKKSVKSNFAESYLAISKKVNKNPYGDLGLAEWPEILPKTIRDRVYLVLMKKKEPLHFRSIAKIINDVCASRRPASAPTVHNELIKDERFVLVGRGMYALAEHGYEPGTAKEVIARILKRNGPLKPRDVILAVQKERFFKPNTVLVNLQNKSHFKRLTNGTYVIRES